MNAKIAGVFFITAILTSLLGGGLIESILSEPDYLAILPAKATQLNIGIYLELVTGIAVVGIVVMLFPILKQHNKHLSLVFIISRIIESIFCILCAIVPILLLSLSREAIKSENLNTPHIQTVSNLLISTRLHMTGLLIPLFFSLGAASFYYILYHTKLLPRFISVWGGIAVILVLIVNLFKPDNSMALFLALPIILNEIFLGIWLFFKGFKQSYKNSIS